MPEDPPPANLGEIVVRGQRRSPGGAFPTPPSSGGGSPDDEGGIEAEEVDPNGQPQGPAHPCGDPAQAVDWNSDAAAAEALKEFRKEAALLGDDDLYEREFGAQIYQSPDGSIYLGRVTWGEKLSGTFDYDETNATQGNLVGEIHSHPGGLTNPSAADWDRLDIWASWTGRNFRTYIVARDVNNPDSDFEIRAYDTTSERGPGKVGPEVNPDAVPCS